MLRKLEIEFYNYKKKQRRKEDKGILYQELLFREESNQSTIKRLGDSVLKLQEILTTEKKSRE